MELLLVASLIFNVQSTGTLTWPGTSGAVPQVESTVPNLATNPYVNSYSSHKDPLCEPGWTAVQVAGVWKCTPAGSLRDPE